MNPDLKSRSMYCMIYPGSETHTLKLNTTGLERNHRFPKAHVQVPGVFLADRSSRTNWTLQT